MQRLQPLSLEHDREAESVRRLAGAMLEKVLDETTIPSFSYRLEDHGLTRLLFREIKDHLAERGIPLKEGGISG